MFRDYVGDDTPQARAKRNGADCIHAGLLAHAAGTFLVAAVGRLDAVPFWLGVMLIFVGTPVLTVGCVRRARAKGYAGSAGALGLLGFVGVMVLACLPDRTRARAGFDVVMPRMASTTWLPPDDDPRWNPRPWGGESLRDTR